MTIEEFATVTQRVIARDGFDGFLPTACFPERREIAVLQGMPLEIEPEPAVLKRMAEEAKPGEEYLVAFKIGPSQFKVVRVYGAKLDSAVFEVVMPTETFEAELWEIDLATGWSAQPEENCVTIIKSDDSGALQISAYQKQAGKISREELLETTDCDAETQARLREGTWGDFSGFQLKYSENDTFWRQWWLAKRKTLLFVTYNCELAKKDTETQEIDQMVGSLRVPS